MLILVGSENKPRASQVSDSSQPRAVTQAALIAACAELASPRAVFVGTEVSSGMHNFPSVLLSVLA